MAYTKKNNTTKSPKGNQSVALPERGAQADEEHTQLVTWTNEADDATLFSRELSEKCRSYYDSNQWTDAEKAKLKSQKQAATVRNRCKPKVDSLMGMERANRTTAKAWPRTPKHAQGATAATEAVRFALQDNMYERQRSDAWENMLIEGTGGVEVIVKPKDDETFKIIIRHIMWDRLIYDPHSRRKDFSDARFLGQVVWMDYDEAIALYPDAEDVLETMQTGSSTYDDRPRWMDNTRRRVKIVEMYYQKAGGEWWYACFTRGGYCKEPMKSPYENEEGETEHGYEFASLFVDREGGRYGSLRQLLDVQDEINKRGSKALHLMSVRQTFGTAGAVADVNKTRAELAKPDGHVEFAYGELNKDFGILPTGDMAQAQFNLLAEAKMEMDLVGANSATMGKDKTVQSGVALRQRALTGQTELAPMFDMLKNLDIRVYRKTWNRIKQYWKAEMWLRVTDDENNLKFVGLNKPVTKGEQMLKQAQAQMASNGMPPEQMQAAMAQMQQRIAVDPMMNEVVSTENDIVNLDVDIVMDDAPDTVTQEVEDFQAMAEMVKSGFPLPPEAVIMASPLSNKDRILKMMKEQPQVSPQHQKQMEQMQEQFQAVQHEAQKLAQENQTLKIDSQNEQARIRTEEKAQAEKAKLAREEAEAAFNLKREVALRDLALEREVADERAKLAREIAVAEHDLSNKKIDFDREQKKAADPAFADVAMLPQVKAEIAEVGKSLEMVAATMAQAIQTQNAALLAMAQAINKPKRITLGGIQRNEAGITGASATVN